MASAAIWLEELGIPPREVCLDWAWQIQTQFANRLTVDADAAPLSWQRIEVSELGQLLLPQDLKSYSPDARLQELLTWAQVERAQSNDDSKTKAHLPATLPLDYDSELRKLTVKCVNDFAAASIPTRANSPSESIDISNSVNEWVAKAESAEQFVRPTVKRGGTKKATRVSSSSFAKQIRAGFKRHKVLASIVAIVLIAGGVFALTSGLGKVNSSNSVALSGEMKTLASNESVEVHESDLDESQTLATIPEMTQFEAPPLDASEFEMPNPELKDVSTITMPNVSNSVVAGVDRNTSDSSTLNAESDGLMDETTRQPSGSLASPGSTDATNLTQRDVMQELEVLSKSAGTAVETDMAVPEDSEASKVSEPWILNTSPMVQTHKLASKIKVRPRQPAWQIQLSVDDEFELTPAEPQDISDRQMTTWLLTDSDSTSPKVRLVIQVQAAPARQSALRWRLFVGAEDMPELMLPLDKEILNPFQDRLRFYAQATQREADRLKQLASTVERDLRTSLSKQRTLLESQSKLASRLSTIVAEARLLDDLLHSHITVYAKLRDGSSTDAPVILQFGDPTELDNSLIEDKSPAIRE